jgi:hypothetical protein
MTPRRACPVCGHPSYSSAGVHPQCVQLRSEPTRLKRASSLSKRDLKEPTTQPSSTWYRPCPACGKVVHVRLKTCGCGQLLGVATKSQT